MQKVLQLIQPNVANGQKTLVALGADPTLGLTTGAAAAIASAFAPEHAARPGMEPRLRRGPEQYQRVPQGPARGGVEQQRPAQSMQCQLLGTVPACSISRPWTRRVPT